MKCVTDINTQKCLPYFPALAGNELWADRRLTMNSWTPVSRTCTCLLWIVRPPPKNTTLAVPMPSLDGPTGKDFQWKTAI